jgi:hypothetical protein
MKAILAALCTVALLLSAPAGAQDKKEAPKKAPSAAQKKQQERMRDCNEQAGTKKMEGDARKKFMSSCLKGEAEKGGMTAQQSKMKSCNKEAGDKKMKGDERKKFMSECLSK